MKAKTYSSQTLQCKLSFDVRYRHLTKTSHIQTIVISCIPI